MRYQAVGSLAISTTQWRRNIAKAIGLLIALAAPAILQESVAARSRQLLDSGPRVRSSVATANPAGSLCPADLEPAIAAITGRPQFQKTRWGILVQALSPSPQNRKTIYSRDAQYYFIPASNTKLLITAAVLHRLGSQFRVRTSMYRIASQPNTVVLQVVGRGDPSFSQVGLQQLAEQLQRRGIHRIDQLIGNATHFQGPTLNPTWELEDLQASYGVPVNSLILNQNVIGFRLLPQALGQPLQLVWDNSSQATGWRVNNRSLTVATTEAEFIEISRSLTEARVEISGQLQVGSQPEANGIAVLDPTQSFLQQLRRVLATQNITVGQVSVTNTPPDPEDPEVAAVESPPLAELLTEMNQASNNLYAEALLQILGATQATPGSTLEAGLAALKTTLTELGVNPESYQLVDGSGLSRHNLISPEALVETLQAMAQVPEAAVYRASLAIAGKSGTLQNRLRNLPPGVVVQAKTGTLNGIAALSGYLNSPNYQPLVFTILVNQSHQSAATLRQAIDEVVLLLARLQQC